MSAERVGYFRKKRGAGHGTAENSELSNEDLRLAVVQVGIDPRDVVGHRLDLSGTKNGTELEGAVLTVWLQDMTLRLRYEYDPILEGALPWVVEGTRAGARHT